MKRLIELDADYSSVVPFDVRTNRAEFAYPDSESVTWSQPPDQIVKTASEFRDIFELNTIGAPMSAAVTTV